MILRMRHANGVDIQVNGKNLTPSREHREIAKWEQALQDLLHFNLIAAHGQKGQIFEVTNLGYQISDMIIL